ncbi:oxidoreductase [Mucilaginibacter sp.]
MKNVILVTGASAGMGKDFAQELLKDGNIVYGAARRLDKMEDIKSLGVKVLEMDVTNEQSMVNGINLIIKAEGRIDILINNAGFGSYGAIEDVPITDARYQLEVNVFGAARLIQLVLPHMRKHSYGKIINITSIGGKIALPLGGWYHASKFALEALSDTLRNEVKPFSIDVVVIEPGGVKSEWISIAMNTMIKSSSKGAYAVMANKVASAMDTTEKQNAEPAVITKLVREAIYAKNPKTRYSGGYMAATVLFLRKILSDKLFDKVLMSRVR